MEDWERRQYWAVMNGTPSTGQQPAATTVQPASSQAHQFIREVLQQDLPPAVEKAVETLEARYTPWPTIVVVSIVATAIATTVLAIKALAKD